ncbi:SUMF1/EgtB/PvdO family nonheme iron enzyme [Paenibacillus dendritiformis]|uniref:SUMF1/EgtB/PvdO family nonheme iron enzyme n=1 Tax=Paenibacillus dendritiformis TaxID=130049 RepID=UPI000DAA267C|nr:SUMF1/EgtB/PvdO family nonheme iron enzyme [Paenibacillus dendritiformis]PZM64867.1 hypothetical protein DOE73_15015 [Paenibacillus dendritiformis]
MSELSLAQLRDHVLAGTRERHFVHSDLAAAPTKQVVSTMVYVPKFKTAGLPQPELNGLEMGGFWVDKYQCSHPNATSTTNGTSAPNAPESDVAVSQAAVVPWTGINWNNAKIACENRFVDGGRCHLMTAKEWAAIAYLSWLLNPNLKGNTDWGKDHRDARSWENEGIVDPILASYNADQNRPMSRVLTGTGPTTWSHNGQANGIWDIVGNVWEWVDLLIEDGVYAHEKTARINDGGGIGAADTSITLDNVQYPAWPSPGVVQIGNEQIRYTTFLDGGNGSAVLTGCTRGYNGTTAAAAADNAVVTLKLRYCIAPPGGAAAKLSANITAAQTTIPYKYHDNYVGAELPSSGFIQIDNEQIQYTGKTATELTGCTRGANGTTPATASSGKGFATVDTTFNYNVTATGDYGQYGQAKMNALSIDPELKNLAIPSAVSSGGNSAYSNMHGYWWRAYKQRAALRGGSWDAGSGAGAFALYLTALPTNTYVSIGFRACKSI